MDYNVKITEKYTYDPKSVEEGYRLFSLFIARAYIRDKAKS
jgi:hypothetical protein